MKLHRFHKNRKKTGPMLARFSFYLGIVFLLGFGGVAVLAQSEVNELYTNKNTVVDPQLLRVQTLIKANVLDLAQSILENEGPTPLPTKEWLAWERQLWTLYRLKRDWSNLLQRVDQIPSWFPSMIEREGDIQAVNAFIQSNQADQARQILRKHLLANDASELDKRKFRRLIIESYLTDNLLPEASMAMKKYQLDYRSQEADLLLLSAQIYLKLDDSDNAINLLAPIDNPEAKLLGIYARLKNQSISPEQAIKKVNLLFENDQLNSNRSALKKYDAMSVVVYAKSLESGQISMLNDLESYLALSVDNNVGQYQIYPQFSKMDLLGVYEGVALEEANSAGLLIGEHSQWATHALALAEDRVAERKAIFGYLLPLVRDPDLKLRLNDAFVDALIHSDHVELVSQFYGEGNPFGALRLNGRVGLALSNAALNKGNISLAAEANNSLTDIPKDMSEAQWQLHVARIDIIAGQYDQGAALLGSWIKSFDKLTPEQTDQVLQPVFDLQTVHQHALALGLLHEINDRIVLPKHRREIAYWMAQSYQSTEQYIKAADYFLYSAMLKDNGFDQWGESARYSAAESLLSAHLWSDARVLIEDLLARAQQENRKLQLQQKLQEMWLLEASMKSIESNKKPSTITSTGKESL